MTTTQTLTPTMTEKLESFKKSIQSILILGLTAIGIIVGLEGILIISLLESQKDSVKDRVEIKQSIKEIKEDFGTVIFIIPGTIKTGYEWVWDDMVKKYNPSRGVR
jgi:hypothetical protein